VRFVFERRLALKGKQVTRQPERLAGPFEALKRGGESFFQSSFKPGCGTGSVSDLSFDESLIDRNSGR
jgi:hypothetical protein